jgi:hypothetical protein
VGRGAALIIAACALAMPAGAAAAGPLGPLPAPNDLFAIGEGAGNHPYTVPVQRPAEPPQTAAPLVKCGPGSQPASKDVPDGRVPAGSDPNGLWCNAKLIAHQGTSGGFKTLRYIDDAGHECAFYDTALLFPTNAVNFSGPSLGVAVLDMSDPAHPKQTDTLTELPMLSPHESLALNPKRGLLAAVNGNPATYPGLVSIYDAHQDCRHPVLQSTSPVARYGHESGFSPDGRTFYATGTAVKSVTAIDVTDPKAPHPVWQGTELVHGMTISDDGTRAYAADPTDGELLILDTTQIQRRNPHAQAFEISRLTWQNASIPQNAIPFTRDGHPYVLEFDEYTQSTVNPGGNPDAVGAGRIIDIADERQPRVISNLRLQVNQAAEHKAAAGDPGTFNPAQGYAAHYCNIPTGDNPRIVACSFIASGLRVFDISDLRHPKEIAYYVAPSTPATENGYDGSNYAMSQPAFAPERHEIWYADGASGFNVLRLTNGVWPTTPRPPSAGHCRGHARRTRTSARAHRHRSASRACARRAPAHA